MISSVPSIAAPCGTVGFTRSGKRCLNVTNRRNFDLPHLPGSDSDWAGQTHALRLAREPSVQEIVAAAGLPGEHDEIVFCGPGEPTLRLYDVLQAAVQLRGYGAAVRLDTDGLAGLVYGRDVTPDLEGSVDVLTVALNAHNAEVYDTLFHPPWVDCFAHVLEFIEHAREFVPRITVTATDELPGVNLEACRRIARNLGVAFEQRPLGALC